MRMLLSIAMIVVAGVPGISHGQRTRSDANAARAQNLQADSLDRDKWLPSRDGRQFRNYDHDRPERGQPTYFADRYHRDGRYYGSRTLIADDRVYRGGDGRYYCRRPDGTTGRIVGGIAGASDRLMRGQTALLGTLTANTAPTDGREGHAPVVCR